MANSLKECDVRAIFRGSNESKSSGDSSEYVFVSGNIQENKETNDQKFRDSDISQESVSSDGFDVVTGGYAFKGHKNEPELRNSNSWNGIDCSRPNLVPGPALVPIISQDHDIVNDADLRDSQESKSSEGSVHIFVSAYQKEPRHRTALGNSYSSEESNTSGYVQLGNHQHSADEKHSEIGLGMDLQIGPRIVLDVKKLQEGHSTRNYWERYRRSPLNIPFDAITEEGEETDHVTDLQQNKEEGLSIKYKCMLLLVVLIIAIVGIAVTIHFLKESHPDAFSGFVIDKDVKVQSTPQQNVLLGEGRTLTVHVDRTFVEDIAFLNISTPIMDNEGEDISVPYSLGQVSKRNSDDWIVSYNPISQIMTVIGPPARCSSGGIHTVTLLNDNSEIIDTFSVDLAVKYDVGQTTLTHEQYEDLDVNQFTCVYLHGCQKSELEFVVDIDNKDIVCNGIKSSSTVTFTETEGFVETYRMNITESLEQKANHVTCQSKAMTNSTEDINSKKSSVSILPLKAITCDSDNGCELKCNDRYGNNYFAVDQLRCDKFYRCYNKNIFSYNCPSGTFFDSSPNVCTCGFKKDLPWCNDNGSLKEGVDVSEKVCGIP